ncbi:transient receptor potential cation channel subfamily V member 6 isoform X2 [Xenopus tropicalis]|uniref:Transient receptor potential cation channel subfamily V member 6 isoform X2 n=1 Tax=Xenopus tropicalis TaxID=8364 RepID=A0A8J1JKX2_XENTR|nr:transient receptor potential cation channel subfamily V member 6 isoform X2 [Xenopus tropicalis]
MLVQPQSTHEIDKCMKTGSHLCLEIRFSLTSCCRCQFVVFYFRSARLLFQAARTNDCLAMERLLKSKHADPFARGSLGETILHIAVLNGKRELAKVILENVPTLVNNAMTSDMYKGETALHIAILKEDIESVKLLLKYGADVINARATGTCFVPGKKSLCYFGEYPLSFAACTGHKEITKLILVDHNAPVNAQDSLGNTVLHILVLQPNKELACLMYEMILALVPLKDSHCVEHLQNNDGFTTLNLAANEGDMEMFNYLIKKQKAIYWTIGTVSYSIYNLTDIDTWDTERSVLDIITSNKSSKVCKLIDVTPIKELLNLKWKLFGRKNFLIWMISYLLYMLVFTTVSMFRPFNTVTTNQFNNTHVTVLIPLLIKLGPKIYIGNASTGGPFSLLMVGYSILIFSAAILRVLCHEGEVIPLSLALIIGWCNSIYFARGFKMLGQFSIMIQKIIFADLFPWFCLVFIIIVGFSSAFYVMCQTLELDSNSHLKDYPMTIYAAIEMMMGLSSFPFPMDKAPPFLYITYTVYMVFVYLLMTNMLIAKMEDTFWRIAHEREVLWKIQIAATILLLERHIPRCLKTRSGISGKSLGLDDDKWYIGVEEILNENAPENSQAAVKPTQPYLCWDITRKSISWIINMKDSSDAPA